METRVTTDFFTSLSVLTKSEQKKGIETIKKISNDTFSSGLRFHKIQHQSNSIFSFSINMDLRIIVHKNDNITTFLYVDHHDQAYDWISKRKILDFGDNNLKIIVPVETEISGGQLHSESQSIINDDFLEGNVIEQLNNCLTEDEALNFIEIQNVKFQDRLLAIWIDKSKKYQVIPDYKIKIIEDDSDLDKALKYPMDLWRIFLHPTQETVVNRKLEDSIFLTGGPGTGKTVCLIHSIKKFLENIRQDECIILTTFKSGLKDYLTRMLKLLECDKYNVFIDDIKTFKLFEGKFNLSNNLDGFYNLNENGLYYYSSGRKFRVKHILFDEFQDFTSSQIDLILELVKNVSFTISFDYSQTIYRPLKHDILLIAEKLNIPVINLNYCYRLNSKILGTLKNVVRLIKILSLVDKRNWNFREFEELVINNSVSVFNGPPIVLQGYSDETEMTNLILTDIENLKNRYDVSEFIMTSFFEDNYMILQQGEDFYSEKFDTKLRKYYKFLPTLKGKEFKVGLIILDDTICQMLNINLLVNSSKVSTKFKGGSDRYRRNLNLLYVALSRFRDVVKIYFPKKYEIIITPLLS